MRSDAMLIIRCGRLGDAWSSQLYVVEAYRYVEISIREEF